MKAGTLRREEKKTETEKPSKRSVESVSTQAQKSKKPAVSGFKIFVDNLPRSMTEAKLKQLFGNYGAVAHVFLDEDGKAYVTYQTKEGAL